VKRLLVLPEDVSPPEGCMQIAVPDDPYWRALFWGAVDQLTLWNSYERDPDHKGKIVADRWRDVFNPDLITPCPEGSKVFWSLDGSVSGQSSNRAIFQSLDYNFGVRTLHYHGFADASIGINESKIAIEARDFIDPAGCTVYYLRVDCVAFGIVPYVNLDWVDCVDFSHHAGVLSPSFTKFNFVARSMVISGRGPLNFTLSLVSDLQCSTA